MATDIDQHDRRASELEDDAELGFWIDMDAELPWLNQTADGFDMPRWLWQVMGLMGERDRARQIFDMAYRFGVTAQEIEEQLRGDVNWDRNIVTVETRFFPDRLDALSVYLGETVDYDFATKRFVRIGQCT